MAQKVLQFTQDMTAAREEVARLGGRVIHQFSSVVFVAELPDETDITALTASSEEPTQPLDEISELAVTAWTTAAEEKRSRFKAAPSPTEGLSWDTLGYEPPREFGIPVAEAAWASTDTEDIQKSTGTPTSRYLIGSVAVGIVMVSRNTGAEVLTDAERIKILQEVQEGLDWLAGVEPRAKVSFVYDIRSVTVSSATGPYAGVTEAYERYERDWRDAALAAMGYGAGRLGYQQYVNDLRSSRHTDWAYVAFFTKYPLNHFAYAVVEKVVMSYANGTLGTDNINRIFAHESCHIFGAADEYGSCVCGSVSGHLAVPNKNCVNCFPPGTQVPCLMNANTLAMCKFSRRQIGWDASLFPSVQEGWRCCNKCQGLFYSGLSNSKCPAGGEHDKLGSGNYSLYLNAPDTPNRHSNWMWCNKCQGLFYSGLSNSKCPAGGEHDKSRSGNYSLFQNAPSDDRQSDWMWCNKCQGLFFGGLPNSKCPAGGEHDKLGSGNYSLKQQ